MNFVLVVLCTAAALGGARADSWRWPEGAASVRIDTKVRFTDDAPRSEHKNNRGEVQADEPQFEEPSNTEGFYNRPPGAGRYPVRVQAYQPYQPYRVDEQGIYSLKKTPQHYSDGTLDSLQYCKCVSTPECNPSVDSAKACGLGKFLCCYKRPNKSTPQNTEFFNEVEDERPMLLPGQGERAGPFPPPPDTVLNGVFGPGHGHEVALLGSLQDNRGPHQAVLIGPEGPTGKIGPKRPVLVGPEGPTGIIGPDQNRGVLVGPDGPTGIIGPGNNRGVLVGPDGPTGVIGPNQQNRDVLVGPGGPTGVIGPGQQNRGVLVGPGGPTGVIGPGIVNKQEYEYFNSGKHDAGQDETAQRGILVGPGGPTGIIGPAGYGRRPVLVGPGGPTGIIGPYGGRSGGRPVLVGPGGPTGMIGPPRRYYGK